jgi:phosphatidylglycerophosphate synthase
MKLTFYDRFYYHVYRFHRACETFFGFEEEDRHIVVAMGMLLFFILVIFACLLVTKALGIEVEASFSDGMVIVISTGAILLNCMYFLYNNRWENIVRDYSAGGKLHSKIVDSVINWLFILIVLLTIFLAFWTDARELKKYTKSIGASCSISCPPIARNKPDIHRA